MHNPFELPTKMKPPTNKSCVGMGMFSSCVVVVASVRTEDTSSRQVLHKQLLANKVTHVYVVLFIQSLYSFFHYDGYKIISITLIH